MKANAHDIKRVHTQYTHLIMQVTRRLCEHRDNVLAVLHEHNFEEDIGQLDGDFWDSLAVEALDKMLHQFLEENLLNNKIPLEIKEFLKQADNDEEDAG